MLQITDIKRFAGADKIQQKNYNKQQKIMFLFKIFYFIQSETRFNTIVVARYITKNNIRLFWRE